MGLLVHLKPGVGRRLAARNDAPHFGIENFGAASGKRIEAGLLQPRQRDFHRYFAFAGEIGNLHRREGLDMHFGSQGADEGA